MVEWENQDEDEGEEESEREPEEPDCIDDDEHDWQRPIEVVGGCNENPGVYSLGGTTMTFTDVCARCGKYRTVTDRGSQRNPGEAEEETEYRDADETSLSWIKENQDEEE